MARTVQVTNERILKVGIRVSWEDLKMLEEEDWKGRRIVLMAVKL